MPDQHPDRGLARPRRHGRRGADPRHRPARQHGARHARGRLELSAARDPAVRARRRDHERVFDLAPAHRLRFLARRLRARRPLDGDDRRLGVLRRDLGLRRRRRRRARDDPDPGDAPQRLLEGGRGRRHLLLGEPCHHYPAVDSDDPLRRDGSDLRGEALRRRHHPGAHRRRSRSPRPPTGRRCATTSPSRSASAFPTFGRPSRTPSGPSCCPSSSSAASSAASSPRRRARALPSWRRSSSGG